jgi:hypothetical protein
MPQQSEIRIVNHVQECSGLVVLVALNEKPFQWMRASELPFSREQIEKLIEKGKK